MKIFSASKTEKLYARILVWTYNKHEVGFTFDEVINEFELTSPHLKRWVREIFFRGSDGDRPMTYRWSVEGIAATDFFSLSDKGIAAAIDYIELKEARESSREAKVYAITAIIISILVSLYQIFIPQEVRVLSEEDGGQKYANISPAHIDSL